jgi:hypothetical protein
MTDTTRAFLQSTLFLVWVGLLSVGTSGVVAGAMSDAWGPDFVAGDLPWVTYTPDRCAELQQGSSANITCREAATQDHADEVVGYRVAAGVLGLLALVGWLSWRRREKPAENALPPALVSGAATAMFLVAGTALAAVGVDLLVLGAGPGGYLSAGAVSLSVAAFFGRRLRTELRSWSAARSRQ